MIAVILVNTGTPDSPEVKDVKRYLRQFLGDKKVINQPWLWRKILVNLIIAPVRGPKSARLYKSIWTDEGSPLLVNANKFTNALQKELGTGFRTYTAMRYQNPSMSEVVRRVIETEGLKKIVLVPMYPQFADSTTGTIVAEFERLVKRYKIKVPVKICGQFFQNHGFIKAFTYKLLATRKPFHEHIIFSYHGLPVKQTERMHPGYTCNEANCRYEYNERNAKCYYAACFATTRLIAHEIGLTENDYTVSFQSRLGMNWLKPYTDAIIEEKALKGLKNMLIISPAFVADCLETIHELGVEYDHLYREHGGQKLQMVESLNDDSSWVSTMAEIVTNEL